MSCAEVVLFSSIACMSIGYFLGWVRGRISARTAEKRQRRKIYCAGWHDGLFYAIGEYDPRYYIEQRALEGFEEYESFTQKPKSH